MNREIKFRNNNREGTMRPLNTTIEQITFNALDSLARHKYMMFGYWGALLVYERRRQGDRRKSPLHPFVKLAQAMLLVWKTPPNSTPDKELLNERNR